MLWFRKDDDRKKRRRRRSTDPSSQSGSSRSARAERAKRRDPSAHSSGRRLRRSTLEDRRERRREDTRDRDVLRRARGRERALAKEQAEVFESISFDDTRSEPQEIERRFARSLNVVIYVLAGLLVVTGLVYGVSRGLHALHARAVLPLQQAVMEGRTNLIRDLIATGAPINGIGPAGGTPLTTAIRSGQLEALRMLLDAGATPTDEAVKMAMRYRQWDALTALVGHGGNPDVRGEWDGRSPLELAAERHDLAQMRGLLDHGADPDAISDEGPTAQPALHYAAENNLRDEVDLLLSYGADPRKLWMGYAPQHLAEDAGHEEMARYLAEKARAFDAR